MADQNQFREEIAGVLRRYPRTRYAKVLLGMDRGLTDMEMADEATRSGEPVDAKRIAFVRETVRMTLADELATGKARADYQAGLYRELLNYSISPELRQHSATCLTKLQQINPIISSEPLGYVQLGANDRRRSEKPQPLCAECNLIHTGDCPW